MNLYGRSPIRENKWGPGERLNMMLIFISQVITLIMVNKVIKSKWARTEGTLSEDLVKSLTIDGTEGAHVVMRPRDKWPSMCFVMKIQEGKVQGSTVICIGVADYKMDLRFEAARLWKDAPKDVWGKVDLALEMLKFPDSGTGTIKVTK